MAIAGINQATVNSIGTNTEFSGASVCRRQDQAVSQEPRQSVVPLNEDIKDRNNSSDVKVNEVVQLRNTRFEFTVHEGTEEVMVKVIDELTDEVIREIPPEEILDMVAKMWELAGLLVDKRA